MSQVNPELVSHSLESDKARVAALFGSSPPVVLKAVGGFIKRGPGLIDHHALRIIAAAAPAIRDPKLVAELIDELPVTGMRVAVAPIDIEKRRAQLMRLISPLPPKVRQRLVRELARDTVSRFLDFVPPDLMSDGANAFAESQALEMANGDDTSRAAAVGSPHATPSVVAAVLDEVEKRIVSAERGSPTRPPGKLPLDVVKDSLARVLDCATTCTTVEDVTRAWRLVMRCDFGPNGAFLQGPLSSATASQKLTEEVALSVLETIDIFDPPDSRSESVRRQMRGAMISGPETPESVARIAARRKTYLPIHNRSAPFDDRFYALRTYQYRSPARGLLKRMSSDEIDNRLAGLPTKYLKASVVRRIENGEALRTLSERAMSLEQESVVALMRHPRLPDDVRFVPTAKRRGPFRFMFEFPDGYEYDRRLLAAAQNRHLDDQQLLEFLRDDGREPMFRTVTRHPAAGHAVLDFVLESAQDEYLIELARYSSNPEIHRRLIEIGLQYPNGLPDSHRARWPSQEEEARLDTQLRDALVKNPTVGVEILGEAVPLDPDRAYEPPTLDRLDVRQSPFVARDPLMAGFDLIFEHATNERSAHSPMSIARAAIRGVVPKDRIDGLVSKAVRGQSGRQIQQAATEAAVAHLADVGSLEPIHWAALTGAPDTHLAMRFATHPNCMAATSRLVTAADITIDETLKALDAGVRVPADRRVKSWKDLPNLADAPFPNSRAVDLIDRQVVDGKELKVIRTPRELDEIARKMGNCLAGSIESARKGDRIIAVADEAHETTAVAWDVDRHLDEGDDISVAEINTRFNTGRVSDNFRTEVEALTSRIRAGTLEPVARATTPDIDAESARPEAHPTDRDMPSDVQLTSPHDPHDVGRPAAPSAAAQEIPLDDRAERTQPPPPAAAAAIGEGTEGPDKRAVAAKRPPRRPSLVLPPVAGTNIGARNEAPSLLSPLGTEGASDASEVAGEIVEAPSLDELRDITEVDRSHSPPPTGPTSGIDI